MAGLVVIHRLRIPRGSSPLGASQLREDPLVWVESARLRRQPGSPSAGQPAPLPPGLTPGGGQIHSGDRRTVSPATLPSTTRHGDLPAHTLGHRAQQGSRSIQRCSRPQGPASPSHPEATSTGQRQVQLRRSADTSGSSSLTPRQRPGELSGC